MWTLINLQSLEDENVHNVQRWASSFKTGTSEFLEGIEVNAQHIGITASKPITVCKKISVRYDICTVVLMKIQFLWDTTVLSKGNQLPKLLDV